MTATRYTRLCIVLLLPLLLAGYLGSVFFWPYNRYFSVLCAPFLGNENCRNVGELGKPFYEDVKKDSDTWFDVSTPLQREVKTISPSVEASRRLVAGAKVLDATPFAGHAPAVGRFMKTLVGQDAVLQLGIKEGQRSVFLNDNSVLLSCNSVRYEDKSGTYSSGCYGDNWSGEIRYTVSGIGRDKLDKLKASVDEEIAAEAKRYRVYQLVNYPFFVYLFLALSLLAWLTTKAVRFVRNG